MKAPPFELSVRGVGWFGRKAPHTLYARIEDHETLSNLAAQCEKLARRVGLTPEKRPFTPHITLAYLKDTPLPDVMHWSETYQTLRTQDFTCDRFELMESLTGKYQQSRYVVQEDYPLTG